MFGLLKKKNKKAEELHVCSPADGKIIPLESVEDQVFSSKMLGDGFAVEPVSGEFAAPVSGVLENVFPTGHAFGIKSEDGKEVLIHIGLDTVSLDGKGFRVLKKEGQRVEKGDTVIEADLDSIKKAGYSPVTMVILVNDRYKITDVQNLNSMVEKGTEILCLEKTKD